MAASVNKVILVMNLGADPELKYLDSGTAVGELRGATNRKYKTKDGEWKEETEWHSVVTWAKTAENCKEYLRKGSAVYVEGRLQTRSWEDKDGKTCYKTEVVAEMVQFLGGKSDGGGGQERAPRETYDHTKGGDDSEIPF